MKTERNYWPLGIVLGSLLFVSIFAAFVAIACTHKSELVSANYYDQEIKFQSRIDSVERAQKLATRASVTYDHATKSVTVSLPREHVTRNVSGEIVLFRPASAGQDRHVSLALDGVGKQVVNVADAPQGLWRVRVDWKLEGLDYSFDQKLVIGPASLQAKLTETKSTNHAAN